MTRSPSLRHTPRRTLLSVAGTGLAAALVLSGCSGGGSGGSTSSDAASVQRTDGIPAGEGLANTRSVRDGAFASNAVHSPSGTATRALISRGTVSLQSSDVAAARFDVQKVVDRFGGEVSDEQTTTDDDGELSTVHLVLRVPANDFAEAMDALKKVARLEYSSIKTEDVTTRVIDVQSRLRAQRRSVHRITQLLDRAQNLRDIVLIEGQLSRRQATLDSLERQSAYLADQTSLSTITVDMEHASARAKKHEDRTGFLAGLAAGWHGLTAVAVAVATALGALLPFTVVIALLALLGWPLLRAVRRHRLPTPPAPAD